MSWGSASSDVSISFDLAFTSFLHADCQSNSRGTRKKVRPDGGSCRIEVPMRVKRTMDFAADRLPSCLLATARNWRASQADGLPCGYEFAQGCEFCPGALASGQGQAGTNDARHPERRRATGREAISYSSARACAVVRRFASLRRACKMGSV